MLLNAKNQMLCSNNNLIRDLSRKLLQSEQKENDKEFWNMLHFQEEIIKQFKKFLNKEI